MVEQHDGSKLTLRKLAADYELSDRTAALGFLQHHAAKGQIVTGLLYMEKESEDLHAHLRTVDGPLNALDEQSSARARRRWRSSTRRCGRRVKSPMELRRLGRSDLHIAPLMLGTNVFGWNVDEATSFAVLDAFVDAGFNAIDTANTYSRWVPGHQGGESETIIGNWLKKSGKRAKVVIATKVGEDMGEGRGLKKNDILREAENSLRRLQTDRIDLYQTHFDDRSTTPEETLQAYAQLIAQGKVRAIGASNIAPARLQASLDASQRPGLARYESLQPRYNLYDRAASSADFEPTCLKERIGVIPYYSLAAGFLTGKYRSEE